LRTEGQAQTVKIPRAIPECGDEEIREVSGAIKGSWVTTVLRCTSLKKGFKSFAGVPAKEIGNREAVRFPGI
jgi:dTDP-4-amino-4,6-dideoxygalactose transaminase